MTDENSTDSAAESVPAKAATPRRASTAKATSTSAAAGTAKTPAAKAPAVKTPAAKAPAVKTSAAKAPAAKAVTQAAAPEKAAAKKPATKKVSTEQAGPVAPAAEEAVVDKAPVDTIAAETLAEQNSSTDLLTENPPAATDGDGVVATQVKRRWPWIVGAAVAVLLIVAGILTAFAVRNAIDSADATTQVLRFDVAYRDTDCSLFESVTTSELRDALLGEPYDCSAWQSVAETLTVDGTYTYDMTVTGTQVNGDSATVSTSETFIGFDGSKQTVAFDYDLTRTDSGWVITDYANA
jgi:hypothetical protein